MTHVYLCTAQLGVVVKKSPPFFTLPTFLACFLKTVEHASSQPLRNGFLIHRHYWQT